ncbi:helix-turn-helix domain-containing protein [Catalinimonas niigatensis]|uniref:helix-turn-helix domain-containing protein n=1 Tax=Catalinimonas niigatensis TaxID=1397264 RepID=UPI002665C75B|nr:helix-turn-helix domain-containing protein [Catalinimonas niigatensis]WPP50845.1 helix-turn-helix domain-containing protein [Catalinimonas niigatensis]
MEDHILLQVSQKIREERKRIGVTVQELADAAGVSKGLISQIENNRTIPSLPVLFKIIKALKLDLNDFFNGIDQMNIEPKVIVKRESQYKSFEKEPEEGFTYRRVLTTNIKDQAVDIVLLEVKAGAGRTQTVKTDAHEYKYFLKGSIEYTIGKKKYTLYAGDSLFFDGRIGHKLSNHGQEDALMLVYYFFS